MTRPSESAKRILCVDDNEDTCEIIRFLLEPSGYQVITAGAIADALRLAVAERFDLYILDSWLPDGKGIELCQQLRALYPASSILFYSGVAQESEIEQAKAAGADMYLVKPTDIDQMENKILELCKKKDSDRLMRQSEELIRTSCELIKDSNKRIKTYRQNRDLSQPK
jgi:two-component system, OmpR family, alkaline phosphatase synthesis response regulator PhoP